MRQHDDTETMSRRLERFWRSSKLWVDWVQWARVELRAGRSEAWWLATSGPRMRKRRQLAQRLNSAQAWQPMRTKRIRLLVHRVEQSSGFDMTRARRAAEILGRRGQLPVGFGTPAGVQEVINDARDARLHRKVARDSRLSQRKAPGTDPVVGVSFDIGGITTAEAIEGVRNFFPTPSSPTRAPLIELQDQVLTVRTQRSGAPVQLDLQRVPESEAQAAFARAHLHPGGIRRDSVLAELRRELRLREPLEPPPLDASVPDDSYDLTVFLTAVADTLVRAPLPSAFGVARSLHTTPRVLLRALDELVALRTPEVVALVTARDGLPGLFEASNVLEAILEHSCVVDGCPNPWRAVLADLRFCELHGREWDRLSPEDRGALERGRYPRGWGVPSLDPVVRRLVERIAALGLNGYGSEVWAALGRAGLPPRGTAIRLIEGPWTPDDLIDVETRSLALDRELGRLERDLEEEARRGEAEEE